MEQSGVRQHRRIHLGEAGKHFQCDQCPYKSFFKQCLDVHYRIHTGAKPYQCAVCNKKFRTSGSIKLHRRMVHQGDAGKIFKCKLCDYASANKQSLKGHNLRIHEGVREVFSRTCELCEKLYTSRAAFYTHIRKQHRQHAKVDTARKLKRKSMEFLHNSYTATRVKSESLTKTNTKTASKSHVSTDKTHEKESKVSVGLTENTSKDPKRRSERKRRETEMSTQNDKVDSPKPRIKLTIKLPIKLIQKQKSQNINPPEGNAKKKSRLTKAVKGENNVSRTSSRKPRRRSRKNNLGTSAKKSTRKMKSTKSQSCSLLAREIRKDFVPLASDSKSKKDLPEGNGTNLTVALGDDDGEGGQYIRVTLVDDVRGNDAVSAFPNAATLRGRKKKAEKPDSQTCDRNKAPIGISTRKQWKDICTRLNGNEEKGLDGSTLSVSTEKTDETTAGKSTGVLSNFPQVQVRLSRMETIPKPDIAKETENLWKVTTDTGTSNTGKLDRIEIPAKYSYVNKTSITKSSMLDRRVIIGEISPSIGSSQDNPELHANESTVIAIKCEPEDLSTSDLYWESCRSSIVAQAGPPGHGECLEPEYRSLRELATFYIQEESVDGELSGENVSHNGIDLSPGSFKQDEQSIGNVLESTEEDATLRSPKLEDGVTSTGDIEVEID